MATGKEPQKFAAVDCPKCGSPRSQLSGAWLRWKREQAGLSLREMAKRAGGFSAVYLSDIERGRRNCLPKMRAAYEALRAA
jgi:transcriptional regulator with XRE-family HTH domain